MAPKIICPSYEQANWSLIPGHMQEGVRNFIEHGVMGGGFLSAVLRGDLGEAAARADDVNRHRLFDYAAFLSQYAPAGCHGSPQNVSEWCKRGGLNGNDPAPDNGKPKIFAFVNDRRL